MRFGQFVSPLKISVIIVKMPEVPNPLPVLFPLLLGVFCGVKVYPKVDPANMQLVSVALGMKEG